MEEVDIKEESRALSIHSAGGGRRPVKVWNASRSIRKALVVSTYEEFIRKGRHKLGFGILEPLRIVLESDGTQVDDGEYFQTLRENSVFLFLRPGESWIPGGGPDALRSAMIEAIPPIVTETLSSLGLLDQIPSWKIMDNKGRVTVVLHWERGSSSDTLEGQLLPRHPRKSSSLSTLSHRSGAGGPRSISTRSTPCLSRDNSRNSSLLYGGSMDKPDEKASSGGGGSVSAAGSGAWRKGGIIGGGGGLPGPRVLSRQGSSLDSGGVVHFHTPQCCAPGRFIHDPPLIKRDSPPQGSSVECDFHCCSLHVISSSGSGGGEIKMSGGLPSSSSGHGAPPPSSAPSELKRSTTKGAHVRFCNIDGEGSHPGGNNNNEAAGVSNYSKGSSSNAGGAGDHRTTSSIGTSSEPPSKILVNGLRSEPRRVSSSSSSDTSSESSELCGPSQPPTPKFLLLIDSPPRSSSSQQELPFEDNTHLSIKDIGIILERLSSRIGDVERLEKEAMGGLVVHWTIKALLKGGESGLRELGILYNNAYYSISEHPGYSSGHEEDEEELPGPMLSEENSEDEHDYFSKKKD